MLDKHPRLTCHWCEPSDVLKTREKTLRVTKNSDSCCLIYGIKKKQTPDLKQGQTVSPDQS